MTHSQPGKPVDNTFVEAFNGTLRRLAHWFTRRGRVLPGVRSLNPYWDHETLAADVMLSRLVLCSLLAVLAGTWATTPTKPLPLRAATVAAGGPGRLRWSYASP